MTAQIIGLHHWFDSPPGRYLLDWEQTRYDEAVVDAFGYHGLQLGMPLLDGLRANRMPHRWRALAHPELLSAGPQPELLADPVALPFPESSIDLLLLPHTLELSDDPHAALREAARVLVPEGRLVISGLNPVSLWAWRQARTRWYRRLGYGGSLYLPDGGEIIGHWRLRDWLRLLGFEVESLEFGCYRPAVRSAGWLHRFAWMDPVGARAWPIFGAAYFVVAVKRVHGVRLLEPAWRTGAKQRAGAQVPVANRSAARQPWN